MGRDSNPRGTCAPSSFQDCRIRPLCHPSETNLSLVRADTSKSRLAIIVDTLALYFFDSSICHVARGCPRLNLIRGRASGGWRIKRPYPMRPLSLRPTTVGTNGEVDLANGQAESRLAWVAAGSIVVAALSP